MQSYQLALSLPDDSQHLEGTHNYLYKNTSEHDQEKPQPHTIRPV